MQQDATPRKRTTQAIFLEEFAKHGNVTQACRVAGVERSTVYRWKERSDAFLVRYNQAFEEAKDEIRAEIYRRAHDGWEEPLVSAGKRLGTVHKHSDTLLIFHAKMLMPEYREKQQVEVTAGTTSQDIKALHEAIAQALAPFPEARRAVASALVEKGKSS